MEIESKDVWVAWTNRYLADGKVCSIPHVVCEIEATAIRMGKDVQGANCNIKKELAVRVKNKWLIPGRIISPSKEDKISQCKLDKKREAIEKAKSSGLSDEDIKTLSSN